MTGQWSLDKVNPGGRRPSWLASLRPAAPLLPACLYLLFLYGLPLLAMVRLSFGKQGFTLRHYVRFFDDPTYLQVLLDTIQVSLVVTLTCLVLGYPVSYFLTRVPPGARRVLLTVVIAPWLMSTLVRTFAWMLLLGRNGPVNLSLTKLGLIEEPLRLVGTSVAVYIGMVHVQMPLAILPLYNAMQQIDSRLVRAAQGLGANPLQAFLYVYFPLSLPGVTGAGLLLFISGLGFYITPALLGGTSDLFIANLIDMQISFLNWEFGAALGFILLLAAGGIILVYNRLVAADWLVGGALR